MAQAGGVSVPFRSRTSPGTETNLELRARPTAAGAQPRAASGAWLHRAGEAGAEVAGAGAQGPSSGQPEPVFPIGVAERLSGLSQRQIRYYEAKGLIRPRRTASGQRLFTAADIRQLRRIRHLLQQGHNVHSLRALLGRPAGEP